MARVMQIVTPLGADVLLFKNMSASESLGRLFEYNIAVLSEKNDIDPDKLLGRNITVKLELLDGSTRCFDSCATRFAFAGVHGRYYRYDIVGRPWTWFLTRAADCRIFQNKKVPDIIKAIFDKYPNAAYELKLSGSYASWDYCVQYRETDFNFVSRLMEQEGIYYYFKHSEGKHVMVLADSPGAHDPVAGYEQVAFLPGERGAHTDREYVSDWCCTREIRTGAYVIDDYDFKRPSVELEVKTQQKRGYPEAAHEFYDWPGEYVQSDEGEHYVRTRMEEVQVGYELVDAASNARGLAVGHRFKLKGHPRTNQNAEYLCVSAVHTFAHPEYEAMDAEGAQYDCRFTALAAKQPFRTQRTTPKPIVQGPQTAKVVGPSGEEIYTDEHGRVKVHFHWDRHGKQDENASCWIRVAHPWAGKNFGMVAVPRIGQEVVVDFIEGDPDQPLITGRVYNAEQMPPWGLPDNKTQTGVLTRSSKGGAPANANAIRFEDKKGEEQLWIHAEKNQDIEVENDETHWVGHDRKKNIDHDETTEVKHDRTETVGNNETITIGVDRTETVGNNETITIGVNRTESVGANETISIGANRSITVGASETATVALQRTHAVGVNETIAIGAAQEIAIGAAQVVAIGAEQSVTVGLNQTVSVGNNMTETVGDNQSYDVGKNRSAKIGQDDSAKVGKNYVLDAGDSVTIKTGSASITMKKDGTIVIKGKDITVEGSGKINVKASSDVVIKGSKILQN